MLEEFKKTKEIQGFIKDVLNKKGAVFKTNSLKTLELVIECLGQERGFLVFGENAYQLYSRINSTATTRCIYIPTKKDLTVYPLELNRTLVGDMKRIEGQIEKNELAILFSSEELKEREVHVKNKKEKKIVLKKEGEHKKETLCKKIERFGYELVDLTKHIGEYSSRGGLIDVYPGTANNPIRIEFYGNKIESIRNYNATTQLTITRTDEASIENINVNVNSVKTITYNEYIKKYNYLVLKTYVEKDFLILKTLNDNKGGGIYAVESSGLLNKREIYNIKSTKKTVMSFQQSGQEQLNKKKETISKSNAWNYEILNREIIIKYKNYYNVELIHKNIEETGKTHSYGWGDYITHEDFGVGVFRGLTSKNNQDYIKIEFKDKASVFISTLKINKIAPYIGVPRPQLHKINGRTWGGDIEKTKKLIQKIIEEMVSVNRNRDSARAFSPKKDIEIEKFLEESFPHVATQDQKNAFVSVDKDLSAPGLMDRIIIGDVGFGKTEVALRAAVKSVCSGGMVMVVVPTTILADQHYISFSKRLEKIGIQVHMLSRFISSKQRKNICGLILSNAVDILIGTHVILNDNIPKNRLSLLIVDEEHKFGVSHKNKLLKIRRGLDVLSLSATPIPRTLQQSLLGVRDVSLVQTPPINRHPIQTRILYKEWGHIKKIIDFELSRAGQIYFLHNRVETLSVLYERISLLFPNVTVAMAHGQMPSKELERVVLSFFAGDISIFVCTSIIESGLDVANANTIIINDSQLFGLSQLYQIRGRVGRGNKQAYCFLLIPDIKKLTPTAVERLRTIESNVALGSGYKISLKDLEIRGSGNLFGYEQSGSMSKVGYHLYCKMFERALEIDKKTILSNDGLKITTFFNSSFEESYMPVSEDRLYYYQRLATSSSINEFSLIENEVVDRYGALNQSAQNMINVSRLRFVYSNSYISKVEICEASVSFHLTNQKSKAFTSYFEQLVFSLKKSPLKHTFTQTSERSLSVSVSVDRGLWPLNVALSCSVYFINNKKNV